MAPQDKQTLLDFLSPTQPFDFMGSSRYSTLVAGLRDCRINTKRDISTGVYNKDIEHGDEGNWLSAIGYFTILDQMGSCYKPLGEPEPQPNANTIKFVIEKFAFDLVNNDDRELNALIALRNAFTHDFNLLNIPMKPNMVTLQQHKFTVTAEPDNDWIVQLPSRMWDGNIDGKDFYDTSDSTFINLFGLGNLAETIYSRICNSLNADNIDLRLSTIRLINKYTFVTSSHPIK
jgi:hypothetical protein